MPPHTVDSPTQEPPSGGTVAAKSKKQKRDARKQLDARKPRLAALDGFRFIAAMMVVVYHYAGYGGGVAAGAWGGERTVVLFPKLSWIAAYGWTGVELFFLISGFVICMSCWGRNLGDFFRSRVMRLFPAYWVAVLGTAAVLTAWPSVRGAPSYSDILSNLTMLHQPLGIRHVDGVYWTLWTELRFYLLFAIVVWKGVTYQRTVLFCALWTVAAVLTKASDSELLDAVVQPKYAPFFIGGVALFLVYRFGPNLLLWGIVGFSWLLAQHEIVVELPREVDGNHGHLSSTICIALITGFYLLMSLLALGKLNWVTWRGFTTLGALTYPLYLLHENIGWTMIHRLHAAKVAPYTILAVVIGAMLVASWLLHRLVERPLAPWLGRQLAVGLAQMRDPIDLRARKPATPPKDRGNPDGPTASEPAAVEPVTPTPTRPIAQVPPQASGPNPWRPYSPEA
ncbi:acyltransferase family protein [Embleya sp. AB8]|uniref:acyltransferase family protein n=1 Tax=Embleya sp. AB8 TaxID=3156304 RepID=UPI003C728BCA